MSHNSKTNTYNNLSCYYGSNSTIDPLKANSNTGVFHTPNYSLPEYDTLNHGILGRNKPYFSYTNAYGSCNIGYTARLCESGCREDFTETGTETNYSCSNGVCVQDTNGKYKTINDCKSKCCKNCINNCVHTLNELKIGKKDFTKKVSYVQRCAEDECKTCNKKQLSDQNIINSISKFKKSTKENYNNINNKCDEYDNTCLILIKENVGGQGAFQTNGSYSKELCNAYNTCLIKLSKIRGDDDCLHNLNICG